MFLSALQTYVTVIIVAVVVLQYAFALFCLLKLAYLDIDKKFYILWNLFILVVFFIGGAVFLVYYYKHPELRVPKEPAITDENADDAVDASASEQPDGDRVDENEKAAATETNDEAK